MALPSFMNTDFGNRLYKWIMAKFIEKDTPGLKELTDGDAPNNLLYYSTTQNTVVYKRSSGAVVTLLKELL